MEHKKKLIEVALPLEVINRESVKERSAKLGHPARLHLWWARRPLAATRAVIWASLVDDPSSLPEQFSTEEEQNAERERLFKILSELVKWENSSNKDVLDAAKTEIMKSTNNNLPALLDPFAGGGSIPIEAQRLGLEAHASDLNPIAVMINKALIEMPPKFVGLPPINPDSNRLAKTWTGAHGLAEDVRYYGEWMWKKAFERIGQLYPKVKDENGESRTVIAWIWARTIKCPNPACGCDMPLASSFVLSKKKGKEAYIQPIIEGNDIRFEVKEGKGAPKPPKTSRGANFKCVRCSESTTPKYIKEEAKAGQMSATLLAIVSQGKKGRLYISPNEEHISAAQVEKPNEYPTSEISKNPRWFSPPIYGLDTFDKLFTNRQLVTLATFCNLINEVQQEIITDGSTVEYARAIAVYLSFVVSKIADYNSSLCNWQPAGGKAANTFTRQALPMTWDFTEANVFSDSYGGWLNKLEWTYKSISPLCTSSNGYARQADAQSTCGLQNIMVSTDPPYYDNIGYAVLSDFFYVWMRQSLKQIYPELFKTMLTPKAEELIASPYCFNGSVEKARDFFENGMLQTFRKINEVSHIDIPVTVYYAFKQSVDDNEGKMTSTGWETMLSAIIQAGFSITGTWPIRTEMANRVLSLGTNALASSIVLVCRKRPKNAPTTTRRDFINTLKRELKPALQKLQASNIAPVDLSQSAIGPGMGVYSRFSKVLEADGTPMSVRSALQIIIQELYQYFNEQNDELDRDSHFCVALYSEYAFNDIKFGEANQWAQSKNTSVEKLAVRGVLYAQKGVVHLLTRDEISEKIDTEIVWVLTQQLTYAMEKDGVVGVARIIADIFTSEPEHAKDLAYRLFTIADRKGWAQEAYAYNSLVIAWPDVQAKAAELQSENSVSQISLNETTNN